MQSNNKTALYYRTAQKNLDILHLDNQMQQLLCYAKQQELDDYVLYADNGFSGITFDRPALALLKADVEAGRIRKIIITNLSRLGRGYVATMQFLQWINGKGVTVVSLSGDVDAEMFNHNALLAYLKGGVRV